MADIKEDGSEIIHFDNPDFQVFRRFNHIPALEELKATRLHYHDDLEFIYVVKGSIRQYINDTNIVLHAGEGIYINSRQLHYVESVDEDCDLYCLIFKPVVLCASRFVEDNFVAPIVSNDDIGYVLLDSSLPWSEKVLAEVKEIVDCGRDEDDSMNIMSHMHIMWNELYKGIGFENNNSGKTKTSISEIRNMLSYIHTNYKDSIKLPDICKAGGVSKTKCTEIFEKYVQMPPIEYLVCYRLEVAATLLKETDLPISEIAFECGFSGSSYFSEAFKKRLKCTPIQYRRDFKRQ